MSQATYFKAGSDTAQNGLPICLFSELLLELDARGYGSEILFGAHNLCLFEDGVSATATEGVVEKTKQGLLVLIPAQATAIVKREGNRTLYLAAPLEGGLLTSTDLAEHQEQEATLNRAGDQLDPLVARWLVHGSRGASSDSLCNCFFGVPSQKGPYNYPHDPSDFLRCVEFLEATQSTSQLEEAKTMGPVWSALVEAWPELTNLLVEEMKTGSSAPHLFTRMQEVIAAAKETRQPSTTRATKRKPAQ